MLKSSYQQICMAYERPAFFTVPNGAYILCKNLMEQFTVWNLWILICLIWWSNSLPNIWLALCTLIFKFLTVYFLKWSNMFILTSEVFCSLHADPSATLVTPGPYGLIFASFVPFFFDIPVSTRFRMLGFNFSDKSIIYVAGLQVSRT
jgi:hypothetical protein